MCSSKQYLIFANLVFLILAFVLLLIGAVIQSSLAGDYSLFHKHLATPASLTIAFGVILSFTALFAIVSVYYKHHKILSVYSGVLVILIVIEVCVGIAGFVTKPHVLNLIKDSMRLTESKYTVDNSVSATWDSLQRDLKCCGVDQYKEWFRYLGNASLPDSCCVLYTIDCGRNSTVINDFYLTGCATAVSYWTGRHEISIAILFTFLIIFQILSVLASKRYLGTSQYYAYPDNI